MNTGLKLMNRKSSLQKKLKLLKTWINVFDNHYASESGRQCGHGLE